MTIAKEIRDAIKEIAQLVKDTRSLVKAYKDGAEFLNRNHPEIKADVAAMYAEMMRTMQGMAEACSIVTSFDFTVSGSDVDRQPARFNEHYLEQRGKAERVRQLNERLKAKCDVVETHARAIAKKAKVPEPLVFRAFGFRSKKRERELGELLFETYRNDAFLWRIVETMQGAVENALNEVRDALGSPNVKPENVPHTAEVLGRHAAGFRELRSRCDNAVNQLYDVVRKLS